MKQLHTIFNMADSQILSKEKMAELTFVNSQDTKLQWLCERYKNVKVTILRC